MALSKAAIDKIEALIFNAGYGDDYGEILWEQGEDSLETLDKEHAAFMEVVGFLNDNGSELTVDSFQREYEDVRAEFE